MVPTPSAPAPLRLTVTARAEGQRLDNFLLRELKDLPRSLLYRLLRKGAIRRNGRRCSAEVRLETGDEIQVPPLARAAPGDAAERSAVVPTAVLERLEAAILHEDASYLVLNKPAGLAVHGGSGLRYGVIEAMRVLRSGMELELGHRLDRETSGCLLLCKNRLALQHLHAALRDGQVHKRYLTLVAGTWSGGPKRCDLPVERESTPGQRRQMRTAPSSGTGAQVAHSLFTPRQRLAGFTTMEVAIGTGRTHQIRVHAQALGHPVAGDHVYGNPQANRWARQHGLARMFLHAHAIAFTDSAGIPRTFTAPLPAELQTFLHALTQAVAEEASTWSTAGGSADKLNTTMGR